MIALMEVGVESQSDAEEVARPRELAVINAVAEALNSTTDVRRALEQTLSLVADLLGLRTGWVWLVDPDTGQFYSAAVQNLPLYLREPVQMTGKPCWCIQTFQRGKLTPKNINVLECSRLRSAVEAHREDMTEGLRYHATIPLYFREQPLGIMNVTSPSWRELSSEELQILSTVAYQTGIAIERSRLAAAETRAARAEERAQIAREIHDTLAQGLTGVGLQLEGALRALDSDTERARDRLQRALTMNRETLEEARRSVLDLRSEPLPSPLPESIASLGRRVTAETGIRVHVSETEVPPLAERIERELYRIAQEALVNAQRHSGAGEVDVQIRATNGILELVVRDDGHGFKPAATPGRFGLVGMRERAHLLDGTLTIRSAPGHGTTVRVRVPIEGHRA